MDILQGLITIYGEEPDMQDLIAKSKWYTKWANSRQINIELRQTLNTQKDIETKLMKYANMDFMTRLMDDNWLDQYNKLEAEHELLETKYEELSMAYDYLKTTTLKQLLQLWKDTIEDRTRHIINQIGDSDV